MNRYQKEAPAYRGNTSSTQTEKAARAELLLAGLGKRTLVEHLTVAAAQQYAEIRRSGTGWPDGRKTEAVGPRSVAYDLAILRTMIRWATTVRQPDGSWLLPENPLRGLSLPRERNPRRPLATHDRFMTTRKVIRKLVADAPDDATRKRWRRLDLALVLAEATGRRIGSIAALRWGDISFKPPQITWRAQFDKRRREQTVPILPELAAELRRARVQLGAVGEGWLFPHPRADRPWTTDLLSWMLRAVEVRAELPKLAGGLWHPYRRKWATERRSLPTVDVMAAGGWADRTTMETCYQQATDAGVLEAMRAPAKLRDRKVSGTR